MASSPNRPLEEAALRQAELRAWAQEHGPALRRYFEKRAGPADAEDLVQEVFLAMHTRGAADSVENVKGYLFRVAANVLSRRLGQARPPHAYYGALGRLSDADEITSERIVMGREALERVIAALEGLPVRTARAFLLHRFEEPTYAAVAKRMGISAKRAEKLIGAALKRIHTVAVARP
jgi:RNA polymerase sigma factor (sigma-70 family)